MTVKTNLIAASILTFSLAGCTQGFLEADITPPAPPSGLRTSTGDNFIEVFWNENRESDVAGYNIFVSTSPNGRYQLIGSPPRAYFLDNGAVNGTTYYYGVTAYDMAGNESALSREIAVDSPRPEGYDVVLSDFRSRPATSGYAFAAYAVVAYNDQISDMWYEYYNGSHYMDVRTDTDIQDMGPTNSILDIDAAPSGGWRSTHDVLLAKGHTYVVWTYDDHYAKFRVTSMSTDRMTFDWAYQLQVSNPLLKRAVVGGAGSRPAARSHRDN